MTKQMLTEQHMAMPWGPLIGGVFWGLLFTFLISFSWNPTQFRQKYPSRSFRTYMIGWSLVLGFVAGCVRHIVDYVFNMAVAADSVFYGLGVFVGALVMVIVRARRLAKV